MMRGVEYGKMTKRETDMLFYMGESIANWIDKNNNTRGELLCVISHLCAVLFTEDTPYKGDIPKQVQDINDFCNYLKFMTGRNK